MRLILKTGPLLSPIGSGTKYQHTLASVKTAICAGRQN